MKATFLKYPTEADLAAFLHTRKTLGASTRASESQRRTAGALQAGVATVIPTCFHQPR